jgi:hypothetical protein
LASISLKIASILAQGKLKAASQRLRKREVDHREMDPIYILNFPHFHLAGRMHVIRVEAAFTKNQLPIGSIK